MILCVCLPAGGAQGRPVAVCLSAGTVPEDAQGLRRFLGDGRRQAEDRIHLSPWLASSPAAAQCSQGGFVFVFFVGHPCSVILLLASVDWGLYGLNLKCLRAPHPIYYCGLLVESKVAQKIPSHRLLWITDWTQSGSGHPICFGNCEEGEKNTAKGCGEVILTSLCEQKLSSDRVWFWLGSSVSKCRVGCVCHLLYWEGAAMLF